MVQPRTHPAHHPLAPHHPRPHHPQTQHPSHSLDTDSPASASSSTLITPLPLDSDSLAHKVSLSSPDLVGSPDTGVGVGTLVGTRKRPSLSLSLGGGGVRGGLRGGEGGGGRGESRGELRGGRGESRELRGESRELRGESRPAGATGAAPEGRMSGKGFIEPHRSHLPRRARTTVRKGAAVTADVGGTRVTSTPTPAERRTIQHLQSPTETSTLPDVDVDNGREGDREGDPAPLQTGLTTLTEPPTSSALPPHTFTTPHTSATPTSTPGQGRGPHVPTTPTPDAGVRPTRSTLMSNTIDAVLASSNQDGGVRSHHHPALGLTMSLAALANASKPLPHPSSSNPLLDAPVTPMPQHLMSLTLSQNAAVVGSPVPNSAGVGVFATPTPAPTQGHGPGHGPGVNLPRRHTRAGAGRRGRSASPGPALALSLAPGVGAAVPATAGVIRFQSKDEGRLKTPLRAQSTSRPPTRTRGKLHIGERERELIQEDLRRAERQRRKGERRMRTCVQRVGGGVGGRVEVGFLEEEWDLGEGWFEERGQEVEEGGMDGKGERRGRSRESGEEGEVEEGQERRDKDKGKGKAPYVLVKVVGTSSSSSSRESSGSSSSSSSSSSSESDNDTDTNADPPHPPHPPNRPTTLRLALPSERSAYADGVPSLSGAQLREACAFVGGWLDPSSSLCPSWASGDHYAEREEGERVEEGERAQGRLEGQVGAEKKMGAERKTERKKKRARVRVRVLAPRWRPEEAMGVVLCYLAGLGSGRAEVEGVVEGGVGKQECGREVNDLAYFPPGVGLPSDFLSAKHESTNHEFTHRESDTPASTITSTSPTPPIHPPTPDVYTYSPLHILAMRLLDDDSGWMGRGALYEARARLGAPASALRREGGEAEAEGEGEKDVFGSTSVPVDANGPRTPSPAEGKGEGLGEGEGEVGQEEGGSDEDTLGSSTEDGMGVEQQQDGMEQQPRGRTRGHAREGAEWKLTLTLRSASLPAPAPAPSRSRALSLPQPKEKEKERRRAKTRERGDLATPVRNGGERKGEGWMGDEEEEGDDGDEEWTGLQDAWRGVLSYDGLVRLAGVLYGEGWVGREMGVS